MCSMGPFWRSIFCCLLLCYGGRCTPVSNLVKANDGNANRTGLLHGSSGDKGRRLLPEILEDKTDNITEQKSFVSLSSGDRKGCQFPRPTVHWHAEGLAGKISKANTSGHEFIYSGEFPIGGYTTCLSLEVKNIDGHLWLGVFFRLCVGPKDELLQWPFRTPYTLSIHHPMYKQKDISRALAGLTNENMELFKRPRWKCNKGWGYGKFIRVTDVKKEGYMFDDAISVSVTLLTEQ